MAVVPLWQRSVVVHPGVPYGTEVPIEPGAQSRVTHTVAHEDTAVAMGTGEVPVLASSRLIAWCERATLECMGLDRTDGETSVAMRVHLDHIKPASLGCTVTTIATLERIEGRRFVFVVSALDAGNDVLATGRIVRVNVKTEPFLASACGQPA